MRKKRVWPRLLPEAAVSASSADGRVRVGDVVYRQPISFSDSEAKNARTMRGTVVYVHPAGRFHVVEFEKGVKESFAGVKRQC